MKVHVSASSRHLILLASAGELLPGAITRALADHGVTGGWLRASGVLEQVELRALDSEAGVQGSPRRIGGRAHVVALEGSVGIARGDVSVGMRAILARETDAGLQTLAGEIVSARVVAMEVLVSAFDDMALTREIDAEAGVALVAAGLRSEVIEPPRARGSSPRADSPAAWSDAAAASAEAEREVARPTFARAPVTSVQSPMNAVVPARIVKPKATEEDMNFPEAGDSVEHFAFGTGDVVKSDGDRLHIRVGKEGKIREIALEMLKVTALPNLGDKRCFRLERKL